MSQRLISTTRDRLENRVPLRVSFEVLPRRLQGLPSNLNGRSRQRQNSLLHSRKSLFLQEDAVWPQKCKGNIPKLNPKKCSFGVEEGSFLGHLITKQGIKANPSKVKAVTDLDHPRTLKDIQSFNGKLAALSRFLSKGSELNYPTLEKLVLALVHAVRRLRRYFQAHMITVLINTPIKKILTKPEKTGRVAKWAIELGEHDIVFLRRTKKETLASLLVEIPFKDNEKKEKPKEVPYSNSKWRLYIDRASNSDGSEAWLMLIDPKGKEYTYTLRFEFEMTNNEAEYEALLAGLRIA
ncbi:reverse transcriptase domain-containing protein [Tanacetum coccineum]